VFRALLATPEWKDALINGQWNSWNSQNHRFVTVSSHSPGLGKSRRTVTRASVPVAFFWMQDLWVFLWFFKNWFLHTQDNAVYLAACYISIFIEYVDLA